MDKAACLEPGEDIRPCMTDDIVRELLEKLYDVRDVSFKQLNGYDDCNYFVKVEDCTKNNNMIWPHGYVLKIMNKLDSQQTNFVEAQNALMLYLDSHAVKCTKPIKNITGSYYSLEEIPKNSNRRHVVRLLTYQPGKLLKQVPSSCLLHYRLGRFVAHLDAQLRDFHHTAYDGYKSMWMLTSVPMLRKFTYAVEDEKAPLIDEVITTFEKEVLSNMEILEKGIIHGDLNEQNIVVCNLPDGSWDIDAVLDFGDSQYSCLLFELAIAACYATLLPKQENDPLDATAYVIAGYSTLRTLPEHELHMLKICICARLVQRLVMNAYTHLQYPDNEYVMDSTDTGWCILQKMWSIPNSKLCKQWLHIVKTYQPH